MMGDSHARRGREEGMIKRSTIVEDTIIQHESVCCRVYVRSVKNDLSVNLRQNKNCSFSVAFPRALLKVLPHLAFF